METSMSILIPTFKAPKWIAEWVDTIWMDLNFTARVAISHDQRTCPPVMLMCTSVPLLAWAQCIESFAGRPKT